MSLWDAIGARFFSDHILNENCANVILAYKKESIFPASRTVSIQKYSFQFPEHIIA